MSEPVRGPIVRLILHPATTIVFAIVGVFLGVVVIRNSDNEGIGTTKKSPPHIEERQELATLKSTIDGLVTTVGGLQKRLSVVEDQLRSGHQKRETATTLTSSRNPSTSREAVSFNAVVTPAPLDGEIVDFKKGSTLLGTGSLTGGSTTFATSVLPVGLNPIKAIYKGDQNFSSSASKVLKQVVKK